MTDNGTMRLFSSLYTRVMVWSRHPKAPWFLGGISFAESSFFPIPPDVMLAPMSLARPDRAWWFATITTITSVAGGLFGYWIGASFFQWVEPWLQASRYWESFELAKTWFVDYGFWAVFIAGFSPIPYKMFTMAAGVMSMAILPFTLASLIGRGARFFLVAGLMKWGGARMEDALKDWVDRLGWAMVALVGLLILIKVSGLV
jgi:membrane protein YqaA with SNARE-associated domain